MTAQDVLDAAKGIAKPFDCDGVSLPLRPLSFDDRRTVLDWFSDGKGTGEDLMVWLFRRHLADSSGVRVLSDESPVGGFDVALMEQAANEVLRRAGLKGDAGKA